MTNFALIGAAGYIAPRHLQAIAQTGHTLVTALDPHDSVGILDSYFPRARFFTHGDAFWTDIAERQSAGAPHRVDYVVVCSPNHLHWAHCRQALSAGAHVICEKPTTLSVAELQDLQELEHAAQRRVFSVLQMRLVPALQQLRTRQAQAPTAPSSDVELTYVTRRGPWYQTSWKGDLRRSGGLAMNIGIHLFDLLIWCFGACQYAERHLHTPTRMAGLLQLERARVRWLLSVAAEDLPNGCQETAHRSLTLDGQAIKFFSRDDLHTATYREILAGRGFGLEQARPAIALANRVSEAPLVQQAEFTHPGV